MRLDVGATRGQKIGFGIAVVLMLVLFAVLGFGFGALVGSRDAGVGAAILLTLLAAFGLGIAMLSVLRTGAWIDGTTLVHRRTFRTRRCDLATASEVTVDTIAETTTVTTASAGGGTTLTPVATGRRIPRLVVRCASGRRPIRVPLRSARGTLLPPEQLRALAAAIMAGTHPPAADEHARTVAKGLVQLADNPLIHAL
jgi:hypothetical protein